MIDSAGSTDSVPSRLRGVLRLVRPLNVALFAFGTMLGSFLAVGPAAFSRSAAWVAALAATLLGAGANAVNDLFDEEIDRINRPTRPLVVGSVTRQVAWMAWAVLTTISLALALAVSFAHGAIALGSAALLFAYAAVGKRYSALKNPVVALVVAAAFPFGALAVGDWTVAIPAAGFAFLTTLAREIVKDIEDLDGDARTGARTLATRYGGRAAARLAVVVVGLTILVSPVPSLVAGYSGLYLMLLVPTCGILLAVTERLGSSPPQAGRASGALKWAMVLGMAALAAAAP